MKYIIQLLMIALITCWQQVNAQTDSTQVMIEDEFESKDAASAEDKILPEFPGGTLLMYEYLHKNMRTPKEALVGDEPIVVKVAFTIEADGKVTNVHALNSVDSRIEEAAIDVIAGMPNWKPGRQGGKPVPVQYMLPITLNIRQ